VKNVDIASAGIRRAERWLKGAERALQDERWDDAVYCSQMAAEQSCKAVLILLGIEYPREHDVSPVLGTLSSIENLPEWFLAEIPEISSIISELAQVRGLAGYGYEQGVNHEYFKDYAPEAYRKALKVHKLCRKLIEELTSKQ